MSINLRTTNFFYLLKKEKALGCLLLGRKPMTNLDSVLKSRHYFANKGLLSPSYGFSSSHVWMGELEYKKAESWRTDAFELWD